MPGLNPPISSRTQAIELEVAKSLSRPRGVLAEARNRAGKQPLPVLAWLREFAEISKGAFDCWCRTALVRRLSPRA